MPIFTEDDESTEYDDQKKSQNIDSENILSIEEYNNS